MTLSNIKHQFLDADTYESKRTDILKKAFKAFQRKRLFELNHTLKR